MAQTWHDVAFLHWPLPAAQLRPSIPPALALDIWDGSAWLGIVPFRMSGVRPRFLPPLPWLSAFPELNVRTYVTLGGKPGVWFFSLDAANPLAVAVARRYFHLPYLRARMACNTRGETIHYSSHRTHPDAPAAEFEARYRPTGPVFGAESGSFASWATERYCLYTQNSGGQLLRGEIHHLPWPLQPAELELDVNTMARCHGIPLPDQSPHLLFARRLGTIFWPPETLSSAASP